MNRKHVYVRPLCVLLLGVWTPALHAQATVELKARSHEVFVGEAFEIFIEINDFQTNEPPQIPELPTCSIRQKGGTSESSYTSIVNGRVTQSRTLTYTYELTPHTIGELLIPPIPVLVDGQVLKTRPVKLDVRPSDTDRLFAVEISTGRSRIYVGQRIQLTMTIWVKPASFGNQVLTTGQMLRQIDPIDFGPFPLRVDNASRRRRPDSKTSDLFYAYEFVTRFVAERPGQLTFDEVEVGLSYPTRKGTRKLRARPTVEPSEILPVPMEGRPPDFNGAVGLYDIEVSANPATVRVGDPIELSIEIFGDGPLETLPPPLLSANKPLADGFRLPGERLAGEVQDGRRRFKLTIRARRDDVTQIPPIEYPYFDPDAERFVIARSDPIALEVAPAAEIAPPDLADIRAPRPAASAAPLQALDGLRDIETSEGALLASTDPVMPGLIVGVALAPPAVFLLTWAGLAYVQSRTADPARRRRQTALRTARGRITQARALPAREMTHEIAGALAGYLADRFDEPHARFAGPAALDFLRSRNVPPNLIEQWAAVVQRCDEASFAGGTQATGDALSTEALACLTSLDRQKL